MEVALLADPHLSLLGANANGRQFAHSRTIMEAVIADLNRRRPDMAVWLGDLTHEGTDEVRRLFRELCSRLHIPALHLLGNHDVERVSKEQFSETVPVVRQQWLSASGWDVVLIDTTVPGQVPGEVTRDDAAFVRRIARQSCGRLLVMAHHPWREPNRMERLGQAVAGFSGVGVYIAGHSHDNRYAQVNGWRVIDIASLTLYPIEYRWLSLSPAKFRLTCITPDVGDIRRRAFDELRALGMEDEARQSYGTPESRDIDFSASADAECGSERALLEGGSTMSANSMKSTCPLPNPEEQP